MCSIKYINGDATNPVGDDSKIIVHICNDVGGWGAGFVLAISARWKEPELGYRRWHRDDPADMPPFDLGNVIFVDVAPNLCVANLIGQHGIRGKSSTPPIRYEAVKTGLCTIALEAAKRNASIHMPRIGCGLAGGNWEEIQMIIEQTLISAGINVTVYDFLPQSKC